MLRKLLILARELDLQNEFEEFDSKFNSRTFVQWRCGRVLNKLTEFDPIYAKNKSRSKAQSRCVT
jgi:aspartokinase/homoserine dehydrogenase 1